MECCDCIYHPPLPSKLCGVAGYVPAGVCGGVRHRQSGGHPDQPGGNPPGV